jgi:hypothetical protein
LSADVASLDAKRNQLSAQVTTAGLQAAQSASAKTFMGGTYLQARYSICKALWQKRRILEYAMLDDVDFSVNDMNMAALAAKNETLNILFHEHLIESARPYVPFEPRMLLLLADLTDVNRLPSALRNTACLPLGPAFKKFISDGSGHLTFTIPLTSPAFPSNFASIRLTGVDARVLGAGVSPTYGLPEMTLDLVQLGVSQFLSPMRETRWYSHRDAPVAITYKIDDPSPTAHAEKNLVGIAGLYTGVSPFASWSLTVHKQSRNASTPPELPILRDVPAILLTFYGQSQPFDSAAPARLRRA